MTGTLKALLRPVLAGALVLGLVAQAASRATIRAIETAGRKSMRMQIIGS